jgi:Fur family transcriptional regulator, stress-responsive regulator
MTDADRLRAAGSPAAYEARAGDSQHRIVCRACGAVTGVDRGAGRAPCLAPRTGAGFAIDEAQVTFWGVCPRCRATTGRPAAPANGQRT